MRSVVFLRGGAHLDRNDEYSGSSQQLVLPSLAFMWGRARLSGKEAGVSRQVSLQFPDGTVLHSWEDRKLDVGSTVTARGRPWVVSVVDPDTDGRYVVESYAGELRPRRNPPRAVPSPWVDCQRCSWRHYPGTRRTGHSWEVATVCSNCGAVLPIPVEDAPAA